MTEATEKKTRARKSKAKTEGNGDRVLRIGASGGSSVTKEDRRAAYTATEGNCHVCGNPVDPFTMSVRFGVAMDAGCAKIARGAKSLDDLRSQIATALHEANEVTQRFGHLPFDHENGIVMLAHDVPVQTE